MFRKGKFNRRFTFITTFCMVHLLLNNLPVCVLGPNLIVIVLHKFYHDSVQPQQNSQMRKNIFIFSKTAIVRFILLHFLWSFSCKFLPSHHECSPSHTFCLILFFFSLLLYDQNWISDSDELVRDRKNAALVYVYVQLEAVEA